MIFYSLKSFLDDLALTLLNLLLETKKIHSLPPFLCPSGYYKSFLKIALYFCAETVKP